MTLSELRTEFDLLESILCLLEESEGDLPPNYEALKEEQQELGLKLVSFGASVTDIVKF